MTTQPAYDEKSIRVLKGLESVRVRPGMYIGDTDKRGLHHLAWEVLDNAVDEAMAGRCTQINIILHDDGETLSVEDNGAGIPTGIHPEYAAEQKTALEIVLTVLHAGGKFDNASYSGGSGGLHGVGVSCVNALSDQLIAEVWQNGGEYKQEFCRGVATTKCERLGDSRKHGTRITFHADPEIFKAGVKFDEELLLKKIRETAFLNAGLKLVYTVKKTKKTETFQFDGGISDFVTYQTKAKNGLYPDVPFFFKNEINDVKVQVAFQYTDDDNELIMSYANNIHTPDGGTHLSGFKTALTRITNQFAKNLNILKPNDNNVSGDDIREGITAIVSVRIQQPQFEGQTKAKLGSVEADGAVNTLFGEALSEFFEKNPAMAKTMIERAIVSQKAREAARKSSDQIKRKSIFGKSNRLPGKLADCNSENRDETELFICEGDSAAGAAKTGRDIGTQAVLPLRGKILNAEKHDVEALLKNTEIQALSRAIGTGLSLKNEDEFKLDDRRYDKIILMTDADVDGSHISTLLLTFFYRFMRPLITEGHIYLAQPPLFKIEVSNKKHYFWSIPEMTAFSAKYSKGKIVRYKGLGEMNYDELAETTMDKASRRLVRVSVDDLADADHMLSTLMGKSVGDRKAFIIEHSKTRVIE